LTVGLKNEKKNDKKKKKKKKKKKNALPFREAHFALLVQHDKKVNLTYEKRKQSCEQTLAICFVERTIFEL
jgi:hypothetical protein